jgi:hypothetical protein
MKLSRKCSGPNPAFERTAASALRLLAVPSSLCSSAAAQRERWTLANVSFLPTRTSASPRWRRLNDRYVARSRVTASGRGCVKTISRVAKVGNTNGSNAISCSDDRLIEKKLDLGWEKIRGVLVFLSFYTASADSCR